MEFGDRWTQSSTAHTSAGAGVDSLHPAWPRAETSTATLAAHDDNDDDFDWSEWLSEEGLRAVLGEADEGLSSDLEGYGNDNSPSRPEARFGHGHNEMPAAHELPAGVEDPATDGKRLAAMEDAHRKECDLTSASTNSDSVKMGHDNISATTYTNLRPATPQREGTHGGVPEDEHPARGVDYSSGFSSPLTPLPPTPPALRVSFSLPVPQSSDPAPTGPYRHSLPIGAFPPGLSRGKLAASIWSELEPCIVAKDSPGTVLFATIALNAFRGTHPYAFGPAPAGAGQRQREEEDVTKLIAAATQVLSSLEGGGDAGASAAATSMSASGSGEQAGRRRGKENAGPTRMLEEETPYVRKLRPRNGRRAVGSDSAVLTHLYRNVVHRRAELERTDEARRRKRRERRAWAKPMIPLYL
ncbi:hypothetical protein MIND_01261500 [Mycena indigotica]|uniref:Uncharacterized protein n=1 Tax=Mycena indigotica TaxID=2126181 RepID=A0A8H6VRC0_9AGAR|nr:uncharacterized protein MIND_01261500 [Mycena indigotica]KAF7291182.1 hypothetical protein MIND_01261500 [Mycena indigotica]